jgi:hypothetical protein
VEWLLGLDRSAQLGKLPIVSQPENAGPRIEAGQLPLDTTCYDSGKQLANLASKLQRRQYNSVRLAGRAQGPPRRRLRE